MLAFLRSRLAATAVVGAVVFGAAVAVIGRRSPADPRVTAAGLLTAGALTVALLLMRWARRRTGPARPGDRAGRRGAPPPRRTDGLAVIPLGRGQAAVVWDEPATAGRPAAAPLPDEAREIRATTDAIWAAVEAAARTPAAPPPPPGGPPGHGPAGRRRRRRPWDRRPRGGEAPDSG